MYYKEFDLQIGQHALNYQRNKVADFLTPLTIKDMRFVYTWPKPKENFGTLFHAFKYEVWIMVIVLFSIHSFLFSLIDFLSNQLRSVNMRDKIFGGRCY